MKIATVLKRKGLGFETVTHNVSLLVAVTIMSEKSIGSLGVVDSATGELLGLISEAELASAIACHGAIALQHRVAATMRAAVLGCVCEDDAAKVMSAMTRERCRYAVVKTEMGKAAGIVSLGDIVATLLEDARLEMGVLRDLARSHLIAVPG